MAGLLMKDFRLILAQKNSLVVIGMMTVVLAAVNRNPNFVIPYLTLVGMMFALSTISYDEFDNGNSFLFTLPITRKRYALEKYIFAFLCGGGLWLAGLAIASVMGMTRGIFSLEKMLANALVSLPIMMVISALLIPFDLKYGMEKGRILLIGTVALVSAVGYAVLRGMRIMNIDLNGLFSWIAEKPAAAVAALAATAIMAVAISCRISIGIMNKKEL